MSESVVYTNGYHLVSSSKPKSSGLMKAATIASTGKVDARNRGHVFIRPRVRGTGCCSTKTFSATSLGPARPSVFQPRPTGATLDSWKSVCPPKLRPTPAPLPVTAAHPRRHLLQFQQLPHCHRVSRRRCRRRCRSLRQSASAGPKVPTTSHAIQLSEDDSYRRQRIGTAESPILELLIAEEVDGLSPRRDAGGKMEDGGARTEG